MAPKRPATEQALKSDHSEPQMPPSSASQRPPRVKSFPKRFKEGIDKGIPGVPTTQSSPSSRPQDSTPLNPPTAETAPRRVKEKIYRSKKSKNDIPATGQTSSQARSDSQTQEQAVPKVSEETPAIIEIYNHDSIPREFSRESVRLSGEDAIKFHENYDHKVFCPAVYVDLDKLKEECNLDLTKWYRQFEPLLSIRIPFSPLLVKVFYHSMRSDNILDNDGNLVEERITTTIRGKQITISAAYLNSLLQIQNPPPIASYNYTDREIFQLLRPDEPVPDALQILNFAPVSMPPKHRAAWYIYTRNLVQKGGNFTHFAKKDFPIFASIIDQVPHNVGDWIFKEMSRFRFGGRKSSQIPFASLISVIMFHEKIWYLPANEKPEKPQKFGQHILNLMRISFNEGSEQSRAPSQSRPARSRAPQSRFQEAQSAPPLQTMSNLDERIKAIVDKATSDLYDKLDSEMKQMKEEMKKGYTEMTDAQEDMALDIEILKDKIGDHSISLSTLLVSMASLHDKMDKILLNQSMSAPGSGLPTAGPSSSEPAPEPAPEPDPIKATTDPADPAPESTPEALPSDPTSNPIDPPLVVDDKGGEELK